MMNQALSVSDLSFSYGSRQALRSVSFDLPKGSFCALLGPNGAGKSTLVSLLTRLLVADEGSITTAGYDLRSQPGPALGALAVVFQQPALDLDLTVRQNLSYFAALHALPRRSVPARIDAALERLNMRERAGETVRSLNGGHRRRTELARSLLHDPELLILDEPTVGLDAAARKAITRHVHELADGGICVLWATHLTDEVRDSDGLLVLHRGQLVAQGTAGNLRGGMPLADWFLARTGGGKG